MEYRLQKRARKMMEASGAVASSWPFPDSSDVQPDKFARESSQGIEMPQKQIIWAFWLIQWHFNGEELQCECFTFLSH
jgi:hypothetical protein